jgi:hypothetical protein
VRRVVPAGQYRWSAAIIPFGVQIPRLASLARDN